MRSVAVPPSPRLQRPVRWLRLSMWIGRGSPSASQQFLVVAHLMAWRYVPSHENHDPTYSKDPCFRRRLPAPTPTARIILELDRRLIQGCKLNSWSREGYEISRLFRTISKSYYIARYHQKSSQRKFPMDWTKMDVISRCIKFLRFRPFRLNVF